MTLPVKEHRRICWICGKTTSLESCKVDEHGLPVHEACQALKLSLHDATAYDPDVSTRKSRRRPEAD
jgi:hypothetical protein